MHKNHRPLLAKYILIGAMIPLLSSCSQAIMFKGVTAGITASANDVFKRPNVNMQEKNYAAADYLSQQMKPNVKRNEIITAQRLEEADSPGISSPLGVNIPREVGLRLMELGYNVYLHDVQEYGVTGMYSDIPAGKSPDYVLKGTYLRKQGRVDVKLRLVNTKSGQIAAHFDYPLLMSREVRDTVKTPTQIYRVQK